MRHANRTRLWAAPLLLGLVLLALAACTETAEKPASSAPDGTRTGDDTGGSSGEEMGTDLIADAHVSFEVTFEWENPARGQQGYFVWTQGNGTRRWDTVVLEDGKAVRGSISIEAAFSRDAIFGFPTLGCLWFRVPDLPAGYVYVGCGSGHDTGHVAAANALAAFIEKRVSDQTIAGRNAACYSLLPFPGYSAMVLCVDSSEGIPLLLATESTRDSLFTQSMEAISVSTVEEDLVIPFGLEGDSVEGFPDYEGQVPIPELLLPDVPELSALEEEPE